MFVEPLLSPGLAVAPSPGQASQLARLQGLYPGLEEHLPEGHQSFPEDRGAPVVFRLMMLGRPGYNEALLNLRVEFENASDSSLDVVVIADFSGQFADIYNRLRRAIQRWCVDAAVANKWEIPFPQITVHRG